MALAEKMLQDSIKNDRPQYTYILAGDGITRTNSIRGAFLAGHWQLSQFKFCSMIKMIFPKFQVKPIDATQQIMPNYLNL
ncbi:MAG: hypothetical protein CM1200mP1_01040 [Candidatus Neomarinimicrobiota bacterium]|nr:MAG: hypothetical protein CM1200mP1_01040 [Candidatus Neomarinimicrobiota bacterium]